MRATSAFKAAPAAALVVGALAGCSGGAPVKEKLRAALYTERRPQIIPLIWQAA